MSRFALIDKEGKVENIILWDKDDNTLDFGELSPIASDYAQIGQVYDGKSFHDENTTDSKPEVN